MNIFNCTLKVSIINNNTFLKRGAIVSTVLISEVVKAKTKSYSPPLLLINTQLRK